jgi:probable rRNA maturation factor
MSIDLDVQYAINEDDGEPPGPELIREWAEAALHGRRDKAELTVRIVTRDEIRQLNNTYRHKDKPTNVLSFPFETPPGVDLPLLGDVVICAAVVVQEAREQGKSLMDHWAHMVVHGVLHLLGYDHITDAEAEEMESLEVEILQQMGIDNPYIDNQMLKTKTGNI